MRFKKFLKYFSFLVIVCMACLYILNFKIDKGNGYITRDTFLYKDSKRIYQEIGLNAGDKVYVLAYYDNNLVKVRYEDENQTKFVGFVDEDSFSTYVFPAKMSTSAQPETPDIETQPVLLYVANDVAFKDFVTEFSNIPNGFAVIGVYLDNSEYSDDILKCESFCEEQQIPYNNFSTFDDSKYNTYIQSKEDVDNVTIDDDMDLSFKFLPRAFDVTNLDLSLMSSYNLKDCFLYSTTLYLNTYSNYFWLDDPNLKTTRLKNSTRNAKALKSVTKAYTFYENSDFKYAYISDYFEQEIDELYQSKLETIKDVTKNATRN